MRFPNAALANTENSKRRALGWIVWAIGPKPNTPDLGALAMGF